MFKAMKDSTTVYTDYGYTVVLTFEPNKQAQTKNKLSTSH